MKIINVPLPNDETIPDKLNIEVIAIEQVTLNEIMLLLHKVT